MLFTADSKKDSAHESPVVSPRPLMASLIRQFRPILLAGAMGLMTQTVPGCAHNPSVSAGAVPAVPVPTNSAPTKENRETEPSETKDKKESEKRDKKSRVPFDSPCKEYEHTAGYLECCIWNRECELANLTTDDEATDEQLAMR